MKTKFINSNYDEENDIAEVTIQDARGRYFVGRAKLNGEDVQIKNRMTGCRIAEYKAEINCLNYYLTCELQPQLKILKQLVSTKASKKNVYKDAKIYRAINRLEEEIHDTETEITLTKISISAYLKSRCLIIDKINKNRAEADAEDGQN